LKTVMAKQMLKLVR